MGNALIDSILSHRSSQHATASSLADLSAKGRRSGSTYGNFQQPTDQPEQVISCVWPVLSKESRAQLLTKLVELATIAPQSPDSFNDSLLALRLAAADGVQIPGMLEMAIRLAKQPRSIPNMLLANSFGPASLINLLSPLDRPFFVQRSIEQTPPEQRLSFLEHVVSQSIEPFDSATDAAIIGAINSLQGKQFQNLSDWDPGLVQSVAIACFCRCNNQKYKPGVV